MSLEANSILRDRYRIIEKIESGGMGAVYLGHDESLEVAVAIKENLFVSPEASRQFEREAKLLASLRHPNLPRVTNHFVIPDQGQYLVMDFIPGENAQQLLKQRGGRFPEAEVLQWAKGITDALRYMHTRTRPIIHRDIKPGNIKVLPEGKAVLVDFGLAKEQRTSEITTKGARALTPGFAPPEQYGYGRTDIRTDVFSLGATLYALLTGQIPTDCIKRRMELARLLPVRSLNPAISPHVAEAIERALNIIPKDRFPNIYEFQQALYPSSTVSPTPATTTVVRKKSLPTVPVHSSVETIRAQVAARGRWVRPLLAIIVVLILVVTGVSIVSQIPNFFPGLFSKSNDDIKTTSTPAQAISDLEPGLTLVPTQDIEGSDTMVPAITPIPEIEPTKDYTPTLATTPIGAGGGQIAFASEREGLPQIYLMNVDGSNQQRLTNMPDGACQPNWSPDGQRLLFVSPCRMKSEVYPNAAIYIMNPDGTSVQPFISLFGGVFDPEWSSAGILFTHMETVRPSIMMVQADGSGSQPVSRDNAYDMQPNWSPQGDKLVLRNTSRSGSPTLYWVFQDGSFDGPNPEQVTRDQVANSPAWSPSGDLIAYTADFQIWVIKWDARGYGQVRITSLGANIDPEWSPDGLWLIFESWREGANHDIYIMTNNGGQQTRLTYAPEQDFHPAWGP